MPSAARPCSRWCTRLRRADLAFVPLRRSARRPRRAGSRFGRDRRIQRRQRPERVRGGGVRPRGRTRRDRARSRARPASGSRRCEAIPPSIGLDFKRGMTPSVRAVAKRGDRLEPYDFLYHASSTAVHFRPDQIMRGIWGSRDHMRFDLRPVERARVAFALFWSLWLARETLRVGLPLCGDVEIAPPPTEALRKRREAPQPGRLPPIHLSRGVQPPPVGRRQRPVSLSTLGSPRPRSEFGSR